MILTPSDLIASNCRPKKHLTVTSGSRLNFRSFGYLPSLPQSSSIPMEEDLFTDQLHSHLKGTCVIQVVENRYLHEVYRRLSHSDLIKWRIFAGIIDKPLRLSISTADDITSFHLQGREVVGFSQLMQMRCRLGQYKAE